VAPDLSIADLIEHYFYRYHFKAFPVLRDRELVGCITAKDVRDLPPGDRTRIRVADVMHPCSSEIIVPPDLEALDALVKMQSGQHSRLLVVEQGRLRGILALSDMLQYLSLKQELDGSIQGFSLGASRTQDTSRTRAAGTA
jgi:CBS domain-containing protein